MLATLLAATDVPNLDLGALGIWGAVISLLAWFARSALNTVDKRLGEIVEKINASSNAHSAALTTVCNSFDAAIKQANARNERLSDQLLELARSARNSGQSAQTVPHPADEHRREGQH